MCNKSSSRLYLFLDYDGTLVPLQASPREAVPAAPLLELLGRLSSRQDLRVAIISGRGLRNLKELIPLKSLYLVGCHGGLIQEPGGKTYFVFPPQLTEVNLNQLSLLSQALNDLIRQRKGFEVEEKEISLALHYRQAGREEIAKVEKEFKYLLKNIDGGNEWEVISGNQVWEVRPRGVNKGRACLHLLGQWPGAKCFYAGDDVTDEDAFKQLSGLGETVLVSEKKRSTAAKRHLKREELMELLRYLAARGPEAMAKF